MNESISKKQIENTVKITKIGTTVKSDDIARVFGKAHKVILKKIRDDIKDLVALNYATKDYFIDTSYIDSRKKTYPRFELTRKGFDLVVLSLTGTSAKKYKLLYIDEFYRKSDIIKTNQLKASENLQDKVMIQLRKETKIARSKMTSSISEYFMPQRVAENKETSQFISRYISSFTKLTYKVLDIEMPKGVITNRDVLGARELIKVEDVELKIATLIKEHIENKVHYKEVYQLIKKELL